MESVAVAPGTACGGDDNSPVRPASIKCKSSTYACVYLNDVRTSIVWEHQKRDFIKCNHGNIYSGLIADEAFAFHLLQIHAKFCIEQPETLCKCRCSAFGNNSQLDDHDDDGVIDTKHEQSALPLNMIIKSEPYFENVTAPSNTFLVPRETSSNSSITSALDSNRESFIDYASAEGVQHISVNMVNANEGVVVNNTSEYMVCEEKPYLSNLARNPSEIDTSVRDAVPVANLFHAANARGPSEVESHFDGLPDGTLCTESDRVAIESPDVSHDQQRELVPITIKIEEGTTFEGDVVEHHDAQESHFRQNTEPFLAQSGGAPETQTAKVKLDFRRTISKCEDCHKVLRGSSSRRFAEGAVRGRGLKCKRCRRIRTKEAGRQSIDGEAVTPRQKTYHSTTTRCATDVMAPDVMLLSNYSEHPGHQWGENKTLAGRSIPSSDVREVTGSEALQEGETENADDQPGENKTLAGRSAPSSDFTQVTGSEALQEGETENADHTSVGNIKQEDVTDSLAFQEGMTGTCRRSSRIQSRILSDKLKKDHAVIQSNAKDGVRRYTCRLCSETFSDKKQLQRHKREETCVKIQVRTVYPKEDSQGDDSGKHIVTQVDETPLNCKLCLKTFTLKGNLTQHISTHTGEPLFSCSICRMTFTYKSGLTTHMRSHTDERPFWCGICGKAYIGSLTRHTRTHTG